MILICLKPPIGLIIDPFAELGSTLVAEILEGYQVLGCEKLPQYYQVAKDRLSQLKTNDTQNQIATVIA